MLMMPSGYLVRLIHLETASCVDWAWQEIAGLLGEGISLADCSKAVIILITLFSKKIFQLKAFSLPHLGAEGTGELYHQNINFPAQGNAGCLFCLDDFHVIPARLILGIYCLLVLFCGV